MSDPAPQPGRLKRQLGLFHAVLLGLGSILGTGVFVSIGIAAGVAGPSVLIAIVLAALLALCNGLSSAQLAAAHPVAGGTYEYGYRFLNPKLGFTAGWMFLLAKSASAATAALGLFGYLANQSRAKWFSSNPFLGDLYEWEAVSPLIVVGIVTGCVLLGIRRAALVNGILVAISIIGLALFVGISFGTPPSEWLDCLDIQHIQIEPVDVPAPLMLATGLMFVAFTGYGRIATLGEEVHAPKRTIPVAIMITLLLTAVCYVMVGESMIRTVGDQRISILYHNSITYEAPLIWALRGRGDVSNIYLYFVMFAAITAMLGVLLNLILGLSRVLLAMGRRRDMPGFFASVNAAGTTPVPAVIGVGVLIAGLTLIGDIKTTWSFAAFTVLIYYGITNLAALRLPKENRLYPRAFAWAGLGGCLFLCWWVQPIVWMVGCGLIALGLVWHALTPRMFGDPPRPGDRCERCGYDLRASQGRCPECGEPIPEAGVS
jgi:APA family basic amino acid/polyamine antiporter